MTGFGIRHNNTVFSKDTAIVLTIIERTVHGPWTTFTSVANKRTLVRWLNLYGNKFILPAEKQLINDSLNISWYDRDPNLLAVSTQFLCDLVTTVLYARGIDVWEVILTTEPWAGLDAHIYRLEPAGISPLFNLSTLGEL